MRAIFYDFYHVNLPYVQTITDFLVLILSPEVDLDFK
jgi:hypothetical protein